MMEWKELDKRIDMGLLKMPDEMVDVKRMNPEYNAMMLWSVQDSKRDNNRDPQGHYQYPT
jgi:hypothetical protein